MDKILFLKNNKNYAYKFYKNHLQVYLKWEASGGRGVGVSIKLFDFSHNNSTEIDFLIIFVNWTIFVKIDSILYWTAANCFDSMI